MPEKDSITVSAPDLFEGFDYQSEMIDGKKVIRSFSSVEEEIYSLYNGVGLRDISYKGIIELRGKDVLEFLHRIATNSTKELPKESLTHTIFTNEKGRIIDIGTLLNFGDYQLLLCSGDYKLKVKSWIERYTITDDVNTADANSKYSLLELQGPQADSFVMLFCGSAADNIADDTFKVISSEDMLFFIAKLKARNGRKKYWIIADNENARNLVEYMNNNKGPYDFNMIGGDAYNIFRVEQGLPVVPNELNDAVNPHEVKLQDFIDFKKGCYIGQEVIARLETYDKVQRYLMGVKFAQPADEGAEYNLFDEEGKDAGRVTSIAFSPKLKCYIGLAFVRKFYAEDGKELTAKSEKSDNIPVTVVNLPFRK